MKRSLALLSAVALAAGATIFSGCAIMPVYQEVPGLNFVDEELIVNLGVGVQEVVKGVRGASYQLQIAPVKEITTPVDAKLIAYDPHGSRIVIRLIPVSDQVTQVRIKAGIFGDEGYSRRILAEIQKNLP